MKVLRNVVLVFAIFIMATAALAQGGGRGGQRGFGGFGTDATSMLGRSDVQKELKLTDDQKAKVKEVSDKVRQARRDMFQNANGDFQSAMQEMQKKQPAWDKEAMAGLNADQTKRLKELIVQRSGNNIVFNAAYQKELGLTEAQIAKLKDLQDKQREAMNGMREKMQNQEMTMEEARDAMQKNAKTMDDEVTKLLTDTQKAKLKEMAGAPFKFDEDTRGGFGGGGL